MVPKLYNSNTECPNESDSTSTLVYFKVDCLRKSTQKNVLVSISEWPDLKKNKHFKHNKFAD